jgi:RNA polymerase sigma factor (sigma-70 family)
MSTATLINPFTPKSEPDPSDTALVASALRGDRQALETLINRHQAWIYNLAFRMVMVHEEAEDVTQEVLVKIVTKLASYDPERARFRTWLYRIVSNHVINMKTRGYEAAITDLDKYYSFVGQIPDQDPEDSPESELIAADLAIGCVMGTLLCLERRQRLAFILAVGFGATDLIGSEIMEISRDAFRQSLSRARSKLREYMSGNCGLINPEAPCRCRKKVKGLVAAGASSTDRIFFHRADRPRLREVVGETIERFDNEIYAEYARLCREHPFYAPADTVGWLRELIERKSFREIFGIDEQGEA